MDNLTRRQSTTIVRLTIVSVRWPSRSAGRRPLLATARPPAIPAPSPPSPATVRRVARVARRLAVAAVLVVAIVLFAAVPAQLARLVMDSGSWDLARSLAPGAPRPKLSPHVLPLLLGAIVVLTVVSSASGHHHRHDHG